ncbi:Pentatricopeptide repeat-containing protein [Acorus gramineus]|uniref:Pentatricopeptide repeat-containing protein n=1 Tax=Acorus gramineus TaxID=55184 RepID=A0AAV9A719_ACOGR|nr:Pentatricopeptide repeat-containing protein [Acorus gramineus]
MPLKPTQPPKPQPPPPPNLQNHWPHLLQISIGSKDLHLSLAIHAFLIKTSSKDHIFECNNLINLYSKFERPVDAQRVFDGMPTRNAITWTSLMNGYSLTGDNGTVCRIAFEMHGFGEVFNEHVCSLVLRACASLSDRVRGEQIHSMVIKNRLDADAFVGTSLFSMYSRTGLLDEAEKTFESIVGIDVRCLNSMILEYGRAGDGERAIQVFRDLLEFDLGIDEYTFMNALSACVGVAEGKQLHNLCIKHGCLHEISVVNAVVTMYGKHGLVEEAERVFQGMEERNLVSWTAMLSAYLKTGFPLKAIDWFARMIALEDLGFDSSCFATVLDACAECKNFESLVQVHGLVIKLSYSLDDFICTALIDAYVQCGNLGAARLVFNGLTTLNIAPFNAILAGEADEDDFMRLFNRVRSSGVQPDWVTFTRVLSLVAHRTSLITGECMHCYIFKAGFHEHIDVDNALITMYTKCGSIERARQIFIGMERRDSVTYNAMISGYAVHGRGKDALTLLRRMETDGLRPDEVSLVAVLQACAYSGLFEDGFRLFSDMKKRCLIEPGIEHENCMVDLLCRSGRLMEAMDFAEESRFRDSSLLWRTLVNGCRLRRNTKFGRIASERLISLAPSEAASYILTSNMYSMGGMLEEAAKARTMMTDRELKKETGCSWIEIDNHIHHFVARGDGNSESEEFPVKLEEL